MSAPESYNTLDFGNISPFTLSVTYNNQKNINLESEPPSHIHDKFEIYFNLSGDVSFIVENHTYPISRGNLIITKPFEYHHCIYHDNKKHEHYCLEFSGCENDEFFKPFYERKKGTGNHIALTEEQTYSIKRHLDALILATNHTIIDNYYHFIRILQIMQSGAEMDEDGIYEDIPENLRKVLDDISQNYAQPITVATLAANIFVSVNTLERYFKRYLNITPSEYIKRKRLSEAVLLLNANKSVSQVAYTCGFTDTSNFIQIFKKQFGKTPYQYQKNKRQL